MSDESRDREEIIAALDRYAEALDGRQWELLDRVFLPELDYDFVAWRARSRAEAVERIREALDGCGPTQHLLGNYRVTVDGDSATSAVYVRAFHLGIGSAQGKTFEMGGEYRDEWVRSEEGWLSARRSVKVLFVVGDPRVLGAG
ncbi:MAG: nuclear transport factor 2 family protein [Deltaproteobacteria bacterium]|nr:nuclear transport factor 2 family protein [Deltaproteobacteria bacterium]